MKTIDEKESFPLFTVIIPVKNRANYLPCTLRTCMMQRYPNFEIIVSDDASTDNTREVVEKAISIDSRIRYYSHPEGLGMRDNFEFALKQIKPGYVIALGGDDGLMPGGIMGMYKILCETGMELLTWSAPIYTFSNVIGSNGQLLIYHKKGLKIVNSDEFLSRQVKNLWYLNDIECPMFYGKSVVSTKLIDRVCSRSEDGRFYSCPTPDGYSGIVLAGEVSHFAFSGEPFSIYGTSASSQGLAYLSNEEKAKKESEFFFQNVSLKPMHKELASQPYSPLITLMTVDYLLTARDLPGWPGSFPLIDYKHVLQNSINELSLGTYGEDRLNRELKILMNIAKLHGEEKFFLKSVRKTRKRIKINYFNGSGVSFKSFFFDEKMLEINNIIDAAFAAKYIYRVYSKINFNSLLRISFRSLNYYFVRLKKGKKFPDESEWNKNK